MIFKGRGQFKAKSGILLKILQSIKQNLLGVVQILRTEVVASVIFRDRMTTAILFQTFQSSDL